MLLVLVLVLVSNLSYITHAAFAMQIKINRNTQHTHVCTACVAYDRLETGLNISIGIGIGIGTGRFDHANIGTSDIGIRPLIGCSLIINQLALY